MREAGGYGGVYCRDNEMFEPAAAFFMYVAMESPRMVGFPLSSQSPIYSVRPIGMLLTLDSLSSRSSGSDEGRFGEGKTVEIVAKGVRFKIRRAMTADSYGVGILMSVSTEGFENRCWDGGLTKLLAARGRRAGICILRIDIKNHLRILENQLLPEKRMTCCYSTS
jgi:hypothetical protein